MTALTPGRIRHTVSFVLAHPQGSDEEADFLAAAARLSDVIPGVEAFEVLREVSPKNDFVHGLSMEFADRAAYDLYNEHPEHVAFVQQRWLAEVTAFQEIDYEARYARGRAVHGRPHARSTQLGTRARSAAGGYLARYAVGESPYIRPKLVVNEPTLRSPTVMQISATERSVVRSSADARSSRRVSR